MPRASVLGTHRVDTAQGARTWHARGLQNARALPRHARPRSNVLRSVTQNGQSLLQTLLMAVILIYVFSTIAYVAFRQSVEAQVSLHIGVSPL